MLDSYKIGDWGLGIGDWAQSPIPIPNPKNFIRHATIIRIILNYINSLYTYYKFKLKYLN